MPTSTPVRFRIIFLASIAMPMVFVTGGTIDARGKFFFEQEIQIRNKLKIRKFFISSQFS
jgi:hypothetical protein